MYNTGREGEICLVKSIAEICVGNIIKFRLDLLYPTVTESVSKSLFSDLNI